MLIGAVLDSDSFVKAQDFSLDDLRARWRFSDTASFLWAEDVWVDEANTGVCTPRCVRLIGPGLFIGRRTPHTLRMLDELIACPEILPECAEFRKTPFHERARLDVVCDADGRRNSVQHVHVRRPARRRPYGALAVY